MRYDPRTEIRLQGHRHTSDNQIRPQDGHPADAHASLRGSISCTETCEDDSGGTAQGTEKGLSHRIVSTCRCSIIYARNPGTEERLIPTIDSENNRRRENSPHRRDCKKKNKISITFILRNVETERYHTKDPRPSPL